LKSYAGEANFGVRRPVGALVAGDLSPAASRQIATDESGEARSPAGQPGWGSCQVTALRKVELLHQCANKLRV